MALRPTLQIEAIKYGLGLFAAGGAAAALLLGVRRQQHTEQAQAHTELDAAERRVTDLYTKAVEQLGSADAAVRLGGLYALERVAQNNIRQRQTIINVLCAYLRMPYTPPASTVDHSQTSGPVGLPLNPRTTSASGRDPHQELQVRLTAQRIISAHLTLPLASERTQAHLLRSDPAQSFWPDIGLDLTGAVLIDWNIAHGRLRNAQFRRATFIGNAWFDSTIFTGDASFEGVTFTGNASFSEATFTGYGLFRKSAFVGRAIFTEATFTGSAFFSEAMITGDASFDLTIFTGDAFFGRATFTDKAYFRTATFTGDAIFSRATFAGNAFFGGATITGDALFSDTSLIGAAFFADATFTGDAYFIEATFTGDAIFGAATSTGGSPSPLSAPLAFLGSRVLSRDGRCDVWPAGWRLEPDAGGMRKLVYEHPAGRTAP